MRSIDRLLDCKAKSVSIPVKSRLTERGGEGGLHIMHQSNLNGQYYIKGSFGLRWESIA